MKTKFLSLLFVITVCTSYAQEDSFQKVLDLYYNCQYKEAIAKAHLLEKEDMGSAYYYITLSLVELDPVYYKDTILSFLEKYVSDTSNYGSFMEAYFSDFLKCERGDKIKKKSFDNFCKNSPKLKYPEISYKIYEMGQKDQWHRSRDGWYFDCRKAKDSINWIKQKQFDSSNLVDLEKIVDQYGWPTDNIFGKNASFSCFFIIQHQKDVKIQEKYLPIIDSLAKLKKIDAWDYFMLKDRILITKGEKQLFGTQSYFDKETGETKRYPQVDYETMERIMLEYGVKPKQKKQ